MKRIGMLGYGSFGRFAAAHLSQAFEVLVADRTRPVIDATSAGITAVEIGTAAACEVVIIAVPVQNMQELLVQVAPRLEPGTLVLEVASVMERPAQILDLLLPEKARFLGLHPMFGPQSGKGGISGLKVVLSAPTQSAKCASSEEQARVIGYLESLGLEVIEMLAEDHDREMATIQGLTHWIAKALREVRQADLDLATPAYRHLLKIEEILREDSHDLFMTIQRENAFTKPARTEFYQRLRAIEQEIEQDLES